jgi:hypothetical protein
MGKRDELESLQRAVVTVAAIEDRGERHKAGRFLESEARRIDDEYRIVGGIDPDAEVDLRAVIKIIFDYVLHDCIEDADDDWGVVMGVDERADEGMLHKIMKGS